MLKRHALICSGLDSMYFHSVVTEKVDLSKHLSKNVVMFVLGGSLLINYKRCEKDPVNGAKHWFNMMK